MAPLNSQEKKPTKFQLFRRFFRLRSEDFMEVLDDFQVLKFVRIQPQALCPRLLFQGPRHKGRAEAGERPVVNVGRI